MKLINKMQKGAAILVSMITLVSITTLIASVINLQSRQFEFESVDRKNTQAKWLLRGASDWAKLLLRQDLNNNERVDHLSEPWAIPIIKTNISNFLDEQKEYDSDQLANVLLSGNIIDVQGKINLKNMLYDNNEAYVNHVKRLFEILHIDSQEFFALKNGLEESINEKDKSVVMPSQIDDLIWYGISKKSILKLKPHATLISGRSHLNINTASAEAIWALAETISFEETQKIVRERDKRSFSSINDLIKILGEKKINTSYFTVRSSNFMALGSIEIDENIINIQSDFVRKGKIIVEKQVQFY